MGAARFVCSDCRGSGWLCAEHPTLPWEHEDCDGVGIGCGCNPTAHLPFVQVFVDYDLQDDAVH
jgi:hypothetical protein